MKVAAKFTVAFLATMLIGFVLYGWAIVRREMLDVREDTRAKHLDIARALTPTVTYAWEHDGEEAACAIIERADRGVEEVRMRWVDLDATGAARPEVPRASIGALPFELVSSPTIEQREHGQRVAYTYVRVNGPDRTTRAIEMKESLARENKIVKEAIYEQIIALVGVGFAAATASLFLGVVIVGRPIDQLSEQARRVGAGDLGARLALEGNDEIALLGREMNAMVDDLVATKEQASSAKAARGQAIEQLRHGERLMTTGALASGIAHELGTPLNVVQVRAKLIASGDVDHDEARECGRVIAEQTARITTIIRQLLDFARRRAPEKAQIEVRALCDRVCALLAPIANERGVSIEVSGEQAWCLADGAQIEQVVTNLAMNGIQAMSSGGVLRVSIELCEHEGRSCVSVEVKDEGEGIAPEHVDRIFEPFFTTKEVGEGTGLGLSVAYGIVAEHAGFIDVMSERGKGSTFRVHLPSEARDEEVRS